MPKPRMTKPLKAGAKNRGVSKPVPQGGKSKSQKAGRKKAPTRSLEDDKARFKQINERLRALDTTRTKAERERERAERECQDAQKEQAKLQKELENLPPSPFPPRFLPPPPSRSLPPRQSRLPWNYLASTRTWKRRDTREHSKRTCACDSARSGQSGLPAARSFESLLQPRTRRRRRWPALASWVRRRANKQR